MNKLLISIISNVTKSLTICSTELTISKTDTKKRLFLSIIT